MLTYVSTSAPMLAEIAALVKNAFMWHRRGQNDCQGAALGIGWEPLSCSSSTTSSLSSLTPMASIFPYVNVTVLPHRPHNIHLLVEMPRHQQHCASIHRCGCSISPQKRRQGSRGKVLFQEKGRSRDFCVTLLKRARCRSMSISNNLMEIQRRGW